mmetsp:Transcript_14096/g.20827  ORF Transcript_14096/g.20827 Transcript_14096/m.20827 type:complete len:179 (+) Transcript_14096:150-686(+)
MKSLLRMLLLAYTFELNVERVASFHDPTSNNPNLPSQYTFTQSISIDADGSSSDATNNESPSSIVSSSMMYYGRYLVSSEAFSISGGDMFRWERDAAYYVSDNVDESDDDDEDDDDDGHSSMLSNASLRRSLVSASGRDVSRPKPRNPGTRSGTAVPLSMKQETHAKLKKICSAVECF